MSSTQGEANLRHLFFSAKKRLVTPEQQGEEFISRISARLPFAAYDKFSASRGVLANDIHLATP